LYTSGKITTIIKDFEEDWNQITKAKLYDVLQFNDNQSNISDAISFASLHLDACGPSKVQKTIFVLTDGYPTSPKKLRLSHSFAYELGIRVIGLGIGFFTDGIFEYFPQYVVVNNPNDVPEALKGYYSKEPSPGNRHGAIQIEKVESVKHEGVDLNLDKAWQIRFPDVFRKEIEKLNKALYLSVAPVRRLINSFQVDLCFVLDTTGSMHGMIKMAKEKISNITKSIKECVKKASERNAIVRTAFVGYKIRGDDGNLDNVNFTENTEEVLRLVNKQEAKGGSKGGVEDKYEPLDLAYNFNWRGQVKFLVLIADAPGHGVWCTGEDHKDNDDHPTRANDMPGLVSKIAKKEIFMFYVNINSFTDFERKNFKKQYKANATDGMKEKGFVELKIESTDDGEKLATLISDSIETIIVNEFM